jgi:NTP-dependent ternary system trypsin peptidase co-occuring protein
VSQLVEFPLDGGGSVRVEVAPVGAIAPAGSAKVVALAQRSLQEALEPIRLVATGVLEKISDLAEAPSKVGVDFGVKLSVEGGMVVARGTAEANFVVKLEWARPAGREGAAGGAPEQR